VRHAEKVTDDPKIFMLSAGRSIEAPLKWWMDRYGCDESDLKDFLADSTEIAPGVRVREVGHGSFYGPDKITRNGSVIAVWRDKIRNAYVCDKCGKACGTRDNPKRTWYSQGGERHYCIRECGGSPS